MDSNQGIVNLKSAMAHIIRAQQIIGSGVSAQGTGQGPGSAFGVGAGGTLGGERPEISNPTNVGYKWSRDDNSFKSERQWRRDSGNWQPSETKENERYTTRYEDGSMHVEEYRNQVDNNGFEVGEKHRYTADGLRIETEDRLEYVRDTSKVEKEPRFKKPDNVNFGVDLGGRDFDALKHEGSVWGDEWGSENNRLAVDTLGYETSASASAKFKNGTFEGDATFNTEAYLARATYEGTYGPADVSANASVGANANANVGLEFNPFNGDMNVGAGGEAFVGGKAEAEFGIGSDYGGVDANAGVTYGLGLEGNVDFGLDDWKLSTELDFGTTLGLGVDLGVDLEVDAKKLTGWIPGTPW